jgi:raffinose/stachyose/melibiose transport system permease protein
VKKTSPGAYALKFPVYLILFAIAAIVAYPILLMFLDSAKPIAEFTKNPLGIPASWDFSSYPAAFKKANFRYAIPNSLFVLALSEVFIVALSSMAAYPIARIKLKMNSALFILFMTAMLVPAQIGAVPLFGMLSRLKLVNSLPMLSLQLFTSQLPIALFVYTGFMRQIPREIEEAAITDGCGPARMFLSIVHPLSSQTTATVVILTSLNVWNNFYYPLIFLTRSRTATLPVAIFALKQYETVKWPEMFAGMSIIVLPMIVLYVLLQKQMIRGMTSGAVKG